MSGPVLFARQALEPDADEPAIDARRQPGPKNSLTKLVSGRPKEMAGSMKPATRLLRTRTFAAALEPN